MARFHDASSITFDFSDRRRALKDQHGGEVAWFDRSRGGQRVWDADGFVYVVWKDLHPSSRWRRTWRVELGGGVAGAVPAVGWLRPQGRDKSTGVRLVAYEIDGEVRAIQETFDGKSFFVSDTSRRRTLAAVAAQPVASRAGRIFGVTPSVWRVEFSGPADPRIRSMTCAATFRHYLALCEANSGD
jgi:hypothetical protein